MAKQILFLFAVLFSMTTRAAETTMAYVYTDNSGFSVMSEDGIYERALNSDKWTMFNPGHYMVYSNLEDYILNKVELNGEELTEQSLGVWVVDLQAGDSLKITAEYDALDYPVTIYDPDGVVGYVKYMDSYIDDFSEPFNVFAGTSIEFVLNSTKYDIDCTVNGVEYTYDEKKEFKFAVRDTTVMEFFGVKKTSIPFTIDVDNPNAVKVYGFFYCPHMMTDEPILKLESEGVNFVEINPNCDAIVIMPADSTYSVDCVLYDNIVASWEEGPWYVPVYTDVNVVITTSCTSGIDNVTISDNDGYAATRAVKRRDNGRIVIEKGGRKYSLSGQNLNSQIQ